MKRIISISILVFFFVPAWGQPESPEERQIRERFKEADGYLSDCMVLNDLSKQSDLYEICENNYISSGMNNNSLLQEIFSRIKAVNDKKVNLYKAKSLSNYTQILLDDPSSEYTQKALDSAFTAFDILLKDSLCDAEVVTTFGTAVQRHHTLTISPFDTLNDIEAIQKVYPAHKDKIAIIGRDKRVHFYDMKMNPDYVLKDHKDYILSAHSDKNQQYFATLSKDNSAIVYENGQIQFKIEGHLDDVVSLDFESNNNLIGTGSRDQFAFICSFDGTSVDTLEHDGEVLSLAFSSDGSRLLTRTNTNKAWLWDVQKKSLIDTLSHDGYVFKAFFIANSNYAVTCSADGQAIIWDGDGEKVKNLENHNGIVYTGEAKQNTGGHFFTADHSAINLWDKEGTLIKTFPSLNQKPPKATFSPTDPSILIWSGNELQFKDFEDRSIISLEPFDQAIRSASFSPDGKRILVIFGNAAQIFDLNGQSLITQRHDAEILGGFITQDDRNLVTYSKDNKVKICLTPYHAFDCYPDCK